MGLFRIEQCCSFSVVRCRETERCACNTHPTDWFITSVTGYYFLPQECNLNTRYVRSAGN